MAVPKYSLSMYDKSVCVDRLAAMCKVCSHDKVLKVGLDQRNNASSERESLSPVYIASCRFPSAYSTSPLALYTLLALATAILTAQMPFAKLQSNTSSSTI
jgi:hypothetical protein